MSHMAPDHRGRQAFKMRLNGYTIPQIQRALRYEDTFSVEEAIWVNSPEEYRRAQS